MKIYILVGFVPYEDFSWVHKTAYYNRMDAEKEAHYLECLSMDEDTGDSHRYVVKEIEIE